MDDSAIIELFFARSEQAIRELDDKYGKVCYSLPYNILNCRQDAEECVNDAYLGTWDAIPPARPNPLLAFLCRIVRNPWWSYVYDEYYDCVICPEYRILSYRTTNRDGYREYCSNPTICVQCPTRHLCTKSKSFVKTVLRHIWKGYEELADDARYTPEYKQLYARRKETIERVFADAKEKHAMRYTVYRGLAQVSNWVRLKFAAMNLKKLARWKARKRFAPPSSTPSSYILFLINVVPCLASLPDRPFFDKL
ncbi:hypothetical protein N510_003456 [Firmicutes bacterium ASF500]|nr:hypothetical protein N510_003456 [Firmicutes bacterium ASF500]